MQIYQFYITRFYRERSFGLKTPSYSDVSVGLFSYSTRPKSPKMNDAIGAYTTALINQWRKASGRKNVTTRQSVKINGKSY